MLGMRFQISRINCYLIYFNFMQQWKFKFRFFTVSFEITVIWNTANYLECTLNEILCLNIMLFCFDLISVRISYLQRWWNCWKLLLFGILNIDNLEAFTGLFFLLFTLLRIHQLFCCIWINYNDFFLYRKIEELVVCREKWKSMYLK